MTDTDERFLDAMKSLAGLEFAEEFRKQFEESMGRIIQVREKLEKRTRRATDPTDFLSIIRDVLQRPDLDESEKSTLLIQLCLIRTDALDKFIMGTNPRLLLLTEQRLNNKAWYNEFIREC